MKPSARRPSRNRENHYFTMLFVIFYRRMQNESRCPGGGTVPAGSHPGYATRKNRGLAQKASFDPYCRNVNLCMYFKPAAQRIHVKERLLPDRSWILGVISATYCPSVAAR
jgi:hypothetical protein